MWSYILSWIDSEVMLWFMNYRKLVNIDWQTKYGTSNQSVCSLEVEQSPLWGQWCWGFLEAILDARWHQSWVLWMYIKVYFLQVRHLVKTKKDKKKFLLRAVFLTGFNLLIPANRSFVHFHMLDIQSIKHRYQLWPKSLYL